MDNVYFPTHTRMVSWLIGVLVGYIMHSKRGHTVIIPKVYPNVFYLYCGYMSLPAPRSTRYGWPSAGPWRWAPTQR